MTSADDVRRSLAVHLPDRPVRTLRRLGEGIDNVAYEADGLVVRVSKEPDVLRRADLIGREAELLRAVATLSPLPVPKVAFVDAAAGIYGYRALPGTPLLDHAGPAAATLPPALGGFLTALHRASLTQMEPLAPSDAEPLQTYLDDAVLAYEEAQDAIPAEHRHSVEAFLATTPPVDPRTLVFSHNDLGAEHILVDPGTGDVTGVIDWSDAAITDPAYDFGLIYRDLGLAVFEQTLAHYSGPFSEADRERAVFYARCALLEDIAYGLGSGDRRYSDAGLSHLGWTFDPAGAAQ